MPGIRPLGTAAFADNTIDVVLLANPGSTVSVTNTSAPLTTQIQLAGSSTASVTSTGASLLTSILLNGASTTTVVAASPVLTAVQYLSAAAGLMQIRSTGASLTPLMQIVSDSSQLLVVSNGPILTTNIPDRGSSIFTVVSTAAVLSTVIPLISTAQITFREIGSSSLTASIDFASAARVAFTANGQFVTGTHFYSTAALVGTEPAGTPAISAITTSADLLCQTFFVSDAAPSSITTPSSDLTTGISLAGASAFKFTTAAPLIGGVNFFSERNATSQVALTSFAHLTTPISGTVAPEAASHIKGRAGLRIGSHDYTSIRLAA